MTTTWKLALGLLPAVALSSLVNAQTVGTNINLSHRGGNQSEAAIAINPVSPSNIVAIANLDTGTGLFAATSTNGGATWAAKTIATGADFTGACCDGSLAYDQFGNLFLVYIDDPVANIVVALSTNNGASFSVIKTFSGNIDQPTITTGPGGATAPGSVWVTFNLSDNTVASGAPVTNLGAVGAFTAAQTAPGSSTGNFGDISIGPTGQVVVVYQKSVSDSGGTTIYGHLDADGLGAGGFGSAITITASSVGTSDEIPGDVPTDPAHNIDAEAGLAWDRSGGVHHGRLYLIYTDESPDESNDTDIRLRYSDNNGATWSAFVRVNDDMTTRSQFLPRIAVDQTDGYIAVSWHDCRNDAANTHAQFFGAVSTNSGASFLANVQISSGTSYSVPANNAIGFGDYTGLAYQNGSFFPAWADNSNATGDNPAGPLSTFDIYTARVSGIATSPRIVAVSAALVSEGCPPTNGVIDPGEMVSVSFVLQNSGSANANVTATLVASSNVISPSVPQSYGALVAQGPSAARTFSFVAGGTCGGTISPMLQLQDGTNDLGTVAFAFGLGAPVVTFTQRFDTVSAPALPAGWVNAASGASAGWSTVSSLSHTAPNSAFANDPGSISDSTLTSPSIAISNATAQLVFAHRYNTESGSEPFDGGVLEISLNGGAFNDIVAAGGSFSSRGYNGTISTDFGSAIAGRAAWSGNSGGFITTVVNLPGSAAGQNIRLRWRMASDSSVAATGWYVDTISIIDGYACCQGLVPPQIIDTRQTNNNVVFSFNTVAGQTYITEFKGALNTNLVWTPVQTNTGDGTKKFVTNAIAATTNRFFRVRTQ